VTPTLKPGVEPGTVDIDLNVKDSFPLHGNVEVNNRYSADTRPLRVSGSVSYSNLWQLGHTVGASFQVSPQDLNQVKVFSGYYLARLASVDWLSVMLQGVKQNSNVSTLGSVAVAGRGEVVGVRALVSLPPRKDFYHSANFGIDYKHFEQEVGLGASGTGTAATAAATTTTPISYYPLSFGYAATWMGKHYTTDLNAAVNFHLRGMGSESRQFDDNRYQADGNYLYFRGDLSHTQKLPGGLELFGKVQGQLADQPLVSSEQFGGGGAGTVRGYLEAEVLGDNAAIGTLELRSPSFLGWWGRSDSEWQVYAFAEGGVLNIYDPLPEQKAGFRLASVGVGSRLKLLDYLNGSIDLALPLISQAATKAHDPFLSFRVWADF
jgi:hemolysin activation/secretion protein